MYDADYYEHGIETGKSNYQNYRWIPELTIPMAMTIIDFLEIKPGESVLDFGCAKGYLVKALRMLHRNAWGVDISSYAIENSDHDIRPYLLKPDEMINNKLSFKFGIAKDVFEHIAAEELMEVLNCLNVKTLFTIVPLGQDGKYIAPSNNKDITHIVCENVDWWKNIHKVCGWELGYYSTRIKGIKDSYANSYPESHLFMVHKRKEF